MHAVILTFPGHFFQTLLTVTSLQCHYPEVQRISFILDDINADPWLQYQSDFCQEIAKRCQCSWHVIATSDIDGVRDCEAGWWRQQLVKLTLDRILDGDHWFVADGDVIFDSRCEIQGRVPISRWVDETQRWSKMSVNYVRDLLGIEQGCISMDGRQISTSAIPFRYLDRALLSSLSSHIKTRFGKDLIQAHLEWFVDQTIVADIDPPTRWVMTEWELIEGYRRWVLRQHWPLLDIGSGYSIDIDTTNLQNGHNLFRHAYKRDAEIGAEWFAQNGIECDPDIWLRNQTWYDQHERHRRFSAESAK